MRNFAPGLAFVMRVKATQKWPILRRFFTQDSLEHRGRYPRGVENFCGMYDFPFPQRRIHFFRSPPRHEVILCFFVRLQLLNIWVMSIWLWYSPALSYLNQLLFPLQIRRNFNTSRSVLKIYDVRVLSFR